MSAVDYEVETPGRRKEKKIYRVNLLKPFHEPNAVFLAMQGNDDGPQEEEIETKFVEEGIYPVVDTGLELMMEEVAPSLRGSKIWRR